GAMLVASTQSLPPRERGSKRSRGVRAARHHGSLPPRERGSKHTLRHTYGTWMRSLPRGSVDRNAVASIVTGAGGVAPPAGAWIETRGDASLREPHRWSLPPRERGSKRHVALDRRSLAGSLPPRERGSKPGGRAAQWPRRRRSP